MLNRRRGRRLGLDDDDRRRGWGGGSREAMRDVVLVAALSVDTVLRIGILFDERYEPYGFFEWIVHPEPARSTVRKGPRGAPRRAEKRR